LQRKENNGAIKSKATFDGSEVYNVAVDYSGAGSTKSLTAQSSVAEEPPLTLDVSVRLSPSSSINAQTSSKKKNPNYKSMASS
jgi:hypothetical protein